MTNRKIPVPARALRWLPAAVACALLACGKIPDQPPPRSPPKPQAARQIPVPSVHMALFSYSASAPGGLQAHEYSKQPTRQVIRT